MVMYFTAAVENGAEGTLLFHVVGSRKTEGAVNRLGRSKGFGERISARMVDVLDDRCGFGRNHNVTSRSFEIG
jgi:hypothetical protein